MALRGIQERLSRLYDVEVEANVDDFVCDDDVVTATVGHEPRARGELLLVAEDDEGTAVGLWVEGAVVEALRDTAEEAWDDESRFGAACMATEGVSHFLYLMFRAENDDRVSQLELELQAEVDKYASALLAGNGVGLLRERLAPRSRAIRARLFRGVRFIDEGDTELGRRYRVAHRLASRYARSLEERYLTRGDLRGLLRELRRFYRLGLRQKLVVADSRSAPSRGG